MSRLSKIIDQIGEQTFPPIHEWTPSAIGDIDIVIDVNGQWYHEGQPFVRDELVRLFASILWFDGERYSLVTPVERLFIQVEDVPFVIQYAECVEGVWITRVNTQQQLVIDADHPVELREFNGVLIPYQKVRHNVWARANRSIYTQWVDLALNDVGLEKTDVDCLSLSSGEYSFDVARL